MSNKVRKTPLKVVILEDGKYERIGMRVELEADGDIIVLGDSSDPGKILKLVETEQPDVAFIDLRIWGDMKVGVNTILDIKKISPEVKCVVLTGFPDLPNFLAAYDAGAEGFIIKDALPDRQPSLAHLARIVSVGGSYYEPGVVKKMRHYLDMTKIPPVGDAGPGNDSPLTERERDVLAQMAQGKSNADIALALTITENTVKTHISNIFAKLGVDNRRDAVLHAIPSGLLHVPPPKD